eukprot:CAMPEP_0117676670 /NCGR_PEP_ID=MMETSP0804-20121206/16318_1 /TAXON_ID=1074897 /ORGANISM="Tetraselmis astigmatica, Strain CCMP880" /LENGTH=34 /DNA_ID= /DNA_START= /DNA_END= /DNA_ORIENTATION=
MEVTAGAEEETGDRGEVLGNNGARRRQPAGLALW